jgi:hypothetical protein
MKELCPLPENIHGLGNGMLKALSAELRAVVCFGISNEIKH